MKKAILGLAFLTIASFSIPAIASNNDNAKDSKAKTECTSKKQCGQKSDKQCKAKCDKQCKQSKRMRPDPFAALNLTPDQKGRVEALNNGMKVSQNELKAAAKKARENKDTAFNLRAQRRDLRSQYIKDLGQILTTEQYVQYLQDYYVNHSGQKMHKGQAHHQDKNAKMRHHGKKGPKGQFGKDGQRGAKGQRSQKSTATAAVSTAR